MPRLLVATGPLNGRDWRCRPVAYAMALAASLNACAPTTEEPTATDQNSSSSSSSSSSRAVARDVASVSVTGALAIITTNALAHASQALDAYVAERRKARDVYVVTEDALRLSGGGETAAGWGEGIDWSRAPSARDSSRRADAIRDWLRANAEPLDIDYVLLIGDPNPYGGTVPMKAFYPYKGVERWAEHEPGMMAFAQVLCETPNLTLTPATDQGKTTGSAEPALPRYEDCDKWLGSHDPVRATVTDYYYSNLTFDWHVDADGDISELIDADLGHQDVHVGRVPVYSGQVEVLDRILRKFVDYGASTDTAWRKNALLVMTTHFTANADFVPLGEAAKARIMDPNGFASYRIYQPHTPPGCADPSCVISGELSPPSYTNVGSVWAGRNWAGCQGPSCSQARQGFGVVYWSAHGSPQGAVDIITTAAPNLDYVASLDDTHPAFVVSASCANAAPESSDNLGATLLDNGAIAFVGASQGAWPGGGDWANPYQYTAASTDVTFGFTSELVSQRRPGGAALSAARIFLWEAVLKNMYGPAVSEDWNGWLWKVSWIQQLLIFNLYGDPTLRILEH